MTIQERFLMLLSSPDDATFDLYDSPHIGHAMGIVTVYAFLSGLNSFLSAMIKSGIFGFSFLAFLGGFLAIFLTWAFLTIVFHVVADVLGGLGELLNAVTYVGYAAAPMAFVTVFSILLTVVGPAVLPDDPNELLPKISLGFSLIGMAWGWPGILCYFGIKNGERLHEAKAAGMALISFLAILLFEILSSNAA